MIVSMNRPGENSVSHDEFYELFTIPNERKRSSLVALPIAS